MANDLDLPTEFPLSSAMLAEIEAARETLAAAKAPSTRRAYSSDWNRFCAFCDDRNFEALPAHPDVVALFIHVEADAGTSPITLGRRVAAINHHHQDAGLIAPVARDTGGVISTMLAGARRRYARPPTKKAPADADAVKQMLATIEGTGARAARNRALLALGMAGAFRRSELVDLQLRDVAFAPKGLTVTIRRSKRDQEQKGTQIAIPQGRAIRPVTLLKHWLHHLELADPLAGDKTGFAPLFRRLTRSDSITASPITDKTIVRLIKAAASAAGLKGDYSGHSLRSGFLTEAAANRANVFKMQQHSRHKSIETVAGYVRSVELHDDHAGDDFL